VLLAASAIHGLILYGDYARIMNFSLMVFSAMFVGIVVTIMAVLRFTKLAKPLVEERKTRTLSESRFEAAHDLSFQYDPFSDVNQVRIASAKTVLAPGIPLQSSSIIP
jgi:hypothetical protein